MKLKKCDCVKPCKYTLKDKCPKCGKLTKDAHYKFKKKFVERG